MKKTKKIFASLGIMAAVAGVGVLAAGCGDEFANAETIKYQDFATFQTEAENPAVNTLDGGYEVVIDSTQEQNTEFGTQTATTKVRAKVEALPEEPAAEAVANMAFTVDMSIKGEMMGINMNISYYIDVTVVTEKVETVDTVNVYFTMNSKNYKLAYTELKSLGEESGDDITMGLGTPYYVIASQIDMISSLAKNAPVPSQDNDGTTYKKVVSGDTTKFQIANTVEGTEENQYKGSEAEIKLVYNKKQLVEFSEKTTATEKDAEGTLKSSASGNVSVKAFNGKISAPKNADKYEEPDFGIAG